MEPMKRAGYVMRMFVVAFLLLQVRISTAAGADFLDPEQAFKFRHSVGGDHTVKLHWNIAKGYKLYRDKVKVSVAKGTGRIKAPVMPKGITVTDPTTNEKMEIYHDRLDLTVPVVKAEGKFTLSVEYQGCSEDGLCYPPITRDFTVDASTLGTDAAVGEPPAPLTSAVVSFPEKPAIQPAAQQAAAPKASASSGAESDLSLAKSTLAGGSLWKIALAFLFFGLLLSFTPCVLPMIPILSSIIVGEGETTRGRSFLMAVAYCLGMALVYTALGVAAGLAGEGLAGALQKPWVLVLFALLLVLLSLSMFDVYQLQMPAALQNRLNQASGRQEGGKFLGVFVMGALSALIVGPCVAAPLAGTLVYISQTKNVVIGGLALFSMAAGMSVPLLLVGLSAGSLLPRAGAWMVGVKYVFGLLLIGVAIWMVSPVLPVQGVLIAWGALAVLCSVFLGVFERSQEKPAIAQRFSRALGLVLFIIGAVELVGAASGGDNPLEPLGHLHASSVTPGAVEEKLVFRRIRTAAELDEALKGAQKPVMLDFYADWCVACKEMDKFTFHDPKVRAELQNVTLLQVDVTANNENDRGLMKRFGLFGPPGIIFFDRTGKELVQCRVAGFMEAGQFSELLKKVTSTL
ncbi:MAG: protein-disulfide reductase DsbD [Chlorobiaceae bacterium]|nr:protein-disulfide reductase DsbD [Chlorobiaceae bacterium]